MINRILFLKKVKYDYLNELDGNFLKWLAKKKQYRDLINKVKQCESDKKLRTKTQLLAQTVNTENSFSHLL